MFISYFLRYGFTEFARVTAVTTTLVTLKTFHKNSDKCYLIIRIIERTTIYPVR